MVAVILMAVFLSASIVAGQTEPTTIVQLAGPEVHPELDQEFNLTVSVLNATETVNGTIRVAWNNTNLQLVSFPEAVMYETSNLNFTLAFVSNSSVPADLRVKAWLSEAFVYDAPWVPELNSIQTGVE